MMTVFSQRKCQCPCRCQRQRQLPRLRYLSCICKYANVYLFLFLLLSCTCTRPAVAQEEQQEQQEPFAFHLLTSEEIHATLLQWQADYPHLISVYTAQDEFGLPTAGGTSANNKNNADCPFDDNTDGCLNYFAVVQDLVAHPLGSDSSNRLPTVLLSGEVHGDERVGPTAVMETTRLMLEAAACEALPSLSTRRNYYNDKNNDNADLNTTAIQQEWRKDIYAAMDCRQTLEDKYGMSPAQRRWLARLVATRRTIVVPTANALGYDRNTREEDGVDPNRDFPHGTLDTSQCMQTIAARTLNELFRHYLVTMSITFHGGTEMIGYEWGTPAYYGFLSPDDIAQDRLARAFSEFSGHFVASTTGRQVDPYLYGDMNSIIYYVRGGFEDFAYAGSWDTEHMVQCLPDTYGGYSWEKTIYDDGMLRAFNMLVEISDDKTPQDEDLGTSWQVLFENNNNLNAAPQTRRHLQSDRNPNGHVSRNIRLAMAAIDLVQPYLTIYRVNELHLRDDVIPLQSQQLTTPPSQADESLDSVCLGSSHNTTPIALMQEIIASGAIPAIVSSPPPGTNSISLHWTVGGAIEIDQTRLWVAVLGTDDMSDVDARDGTQWLQEYYCGKTIPDPYMLEKYFTAITESPLQGSGFFSPYGSRPFSEGDGVNTMGPAFRTNLELAAFNITETTTARHLVVIASAKVDPSWEQLPENARVGPNFGPQSHMVQSRTNPKWYHQNDQGHVIQGQVEWFSEPILLEVHLNESSSDAGNNGGTTVQINDRFQFPNAIIPGEEVGETTDTLDRPSSFPLSSATPSQAPTTTTGAISRPLKRRKEAPEPKCGSLAVRNGRGGRAGQARGCTSSGFRRRQAGEDLWQALQNVDDNSNGDRNLLRQSNSRIGESRRRQAARNKHRLEILRGQKPIERP